MKKVRPRSPLYVISTLLLPWRLVNTYYILDGGILTISRYYAQRNGGFQRKVDSFHLMDLAAYGFPRDLGTELMEPVLTGKGVYLSQEVQFLLADGSVIPWNVRPYTRKQVRDLAVSIADKATLEPGSLLAKGARLHD